MMYIIGVVISLVVGGHYAVTRAGAERRAHRWLRQHHYRVVSLRTPLFRMPRFAPRMFRDSDNVFDFEALVEDTQLGGTAKLSLRVWTDFLGRRDGEVEVFVDEISSAEEVPPLFGRLADAQIAVLRRIAEGETEFYPPRRSDMSGENFNELAEHVLALSRRGMITCGRPVMDATARNYMSIGDVALTLDGNAWPMEQEKEARGDQA